MSTETYLEKFYSWVTTEATQGFELQHSSNDKQLYDNSDQRKKFGPKTRLRPKTNKLDGILKIEPKCFAN